MKKTVFIILYFYYFDTLFRNILNKTIKDDWIWTNNKKFNEYNLSLAKPDHNEREKRGSCGSLTLGRENELILKAFPCSTASTRFICEYCK